MYQTVLNVAKQCLYHALIDSVFHLNMNVHFTFVELEGVCVMSLIWLSVVNRFSEVQSFKKIFYFRSLSSENQFLCLM